MVENEIGKILKYLKLDNDGEYCGKDFNEYYAYNVIIRIKVFLRTPQENRILERINRKILECARCMRLHVGLPLFMWANIVDTVVYLINRGLLVLYMEGF